MKRIIANEATELRSEIDSAVELYITPRNVGKNSQILLNPPKFAFFPYLGVS